MEISAGTCIAVGVGVGGGLVHTGREEAELEGSQIEIQNNSAQTRGGANYTCSGHGSDDSGPKRPGLLLRP